jgi:hypothetical protein
MLKDAGLSLASWLRSLLPPGTGVRFDAPQGRWEHGPEAPFVSVFLCDVGRDGQELAFSGWSEARDGDRRLVGRQPAARYYRLGYLVTAWAGAARPDQDGSQRALEEHGLLGLLVDACASTDTLADGHLTGALAEAGLPCTVRCAGDDRVRPVQGLWPGLGIAPRAHLVLELVAPVVPPMVTDLAPAAREIVLGTGRLPGPGTPAGSAPARAREVVRRRERPAVADPRS